MADELSAAEKAQAIIDASPEEETPSETPETTQEAPDKDKPKETPDKPTEETPTTDQLYAGVFQTPELLEKSATELATTLAKSTLERRVLRQAISEAKESGDFSEVEDIYKEMRSDQSKRNQDPPEQKGADAPAQSGEYTPLSEGERITYLRGQIADEIKKDAELVSKFREKGIDLPTAEIGSREWKDQMFELADTSPALHDMLQRRVEAQARHEAEFLDTYEKTVVGEKDALNTARTEGQKYLSQVNTELSMNLTPDDIAGIVSQALKDPRSFEKQFDVSIAKKDAVEEYFSRNVLRGKVKAIVENAKNQGALEQSKGLRKLREEAQTTAGKQRLSNPSERRGVDKPKFDTTNNASSATHEQREARVQEILNNSQDRD